MHCELSPSLLSWPLFNKPERLQVMLAILLSREEDGSISPDLVTRLPLITGLSVVTVQRSIQDLIDANVLMCVTGLNIPTQLIVTNLPEGIGCQSARSLQSSAVNDKAIESPLPTPPLAVRKNAIKSPSSAKRFVKPTLEEVTAYIHDQGYSVDPQYFMDYEETVGWVVGKTRKPMKDWQAAIRNMERTNHKSSTTNHKPLSSYEQQRQSSRDLYLAAEAGISLEVVAGASLSAIPDIAPCDDVAPFLPTVHVGER